MADLLRKTIGWGCTALLVATTPSACGSDSADAKKGTPASGGESAGTAGDTSARGASDGGSTLAAGSGHGPSGGLGTSAGATAGAGGVFGLRPGDQCETHDDCVLDNDCCHCKAYMDRLPENHGCGVEDCDETACEAQGITRVLCLNGNCLLEKVDCDPTHVTCDEEPPTCGDGDFPRVEDGCWAGCVAPQHCADFVHFGCEECREGQQCVTWSWCAGDSCGGALTCRELPAECGGVFTCECAGDAICASRSTGYRCYERASGTYCCGGSGTCSLAGG